MSADNTSIFYQIGQATKSNVSDAITAFKAANNVYTGTNEFQEAVTVGTSGVNKNLQVNGDATVTGNFTVQGLTTTLSTSNLDVNDNFIRLSKGANLGAFTKDQGFLFERAQGSQAGAFLFDESTDTFRLGTIPPVSTQVVGSENVTFTGKTANVKVTVTVSGSDASVSGVRTDNSGTDEIAFTVGSLAKVSDLIANSEVANYVIVSTDGDGNTALSAIAQFSLVAPDGTSATADILGGTLGLEKVILDGTNLGNLADFNAGLSA